MVCIADTGFSQSSNARVQRFVNSGSSPFPTWFTSFSNQRLDVFNNNLLLFVTEYNGTQHLVFAQQLSFGFNHQHCAFGTCNNQIQLAFLQLICCWVQHILVVDVTNAGCTDWAIEWNTRQAQGSRSTDHRNDVWANLRVYGNNGSDNLNFVQEAFWEQWANWAVNQTRNQSFAFTRTAFTAEETTWETTSSVGTLLIVNGQREEALAFFSFFSANNGNEYRGVVHGNHDSSSGLASHHASFQSYGILTVLEFANDRIQQSIFLIFVSSVTPYAALLLIICLRSLRCILATNGNHWHSRDLH